MSIQEDYLTGIANAIREKTGETGTIQASKFAEEISGIQVASALEERTITPSTTQQIITPNMGYDGMSKVTVEAIPSGELGTPSISANGVITASVSKGGYLPAGTQKTAQAATQAAKTVRPTTYAQTAVAKGVYTTGVVTVEGDANLIASNIKNGVSIFGVNGSAAGWNVLQTTAQTDGNSVLLFTIPQGLSRIKRIDLQIKTPVETLFCTNAAMCDLPTAPVPGDGSMDYNVNPCLVDALGPGLGLEMFTSYQQTWRMNRNGTTITITQISTNGSDVRAFAPLSTFDITVIWG